MGNTLSGSGPCREAVVALGPPSAELARRLDAFGAQPNDVAARDELRRASNALQTTVEHIVTDTRLNVQVGERALLMKANKALVALSSALTTLLCERRALPESRAPELRVALGERVLTDAPSVIADSLPADATAYLRRATGHVEQLVRILTQTP